MDDHRKIDYARAVRDPEYAREVFFRLVALNNEIYESANSFLLMLHRENRPLPIEGWDSERAIKNFRHLLKFPASDSIDLM